VPLNVPKLAQTKAFFELHKLELAVACHKLYASVWSRDLTSTDYVSPATVTRLGDTGCTWLIVFSQEADEAGLSVVQGITTLNTSCQWA
jgi:hypothetical protein